MKAEEDKNSGGRGSLEATLKLGKQKSKSTCEIERATDPCAIVIFGASGDLTSRKLIPSLFKLYINKLLPDEFLIVGAARKDMDDDSFRESVAASLKATESGEEGRDYKEEFLKNIYYQQLTYDNAGSYNNLSERLNELEKVGIPGGNRIYYLATPPEIYTSISDNLGLSGMANQESGWRRIVVEKPFGRDTDTASELNERIKSYFSEGQIFRIDHYLGKETVQDVLMFRFANAIFEPLWDRTYIDHVQITTAESLGIEKRSGYYEKAGILRDMFQNHMLQLVALIAMEPPAVFDADSVRNEKVKVLKSIRPINLESLKKQLSLGQYGKGSIDGESVPSYREEEGVKEESVTPTFAALKLYLDSWRWKGVPFYLRSGKRLASRKTEIAVQFRHVPHSMFKNVMAGEISPNTLVFTIQPNEGITLSMQTKKPGTKVCLREVVMDFNYSDFYSGVSVDAYERVLIDCLEGDHTLFVREDGVDQAWKLLTPIIEAIESDPSLIHLESYPAGSTGPATADILMERDDRRWRDI